MMNNKQAYLIIAHKDDYTFHTLISMLDDENNDIFIHMDKKNKEYNEEDTNKLVKKAGIYHSSRSSVAWGGYSLINAEMILLHKATETGHYNHYHLLSGQDLPIQTQDVIQNFFIENADKEFVGFDKDVFAYEDRVYYRYYFRELIGRNRLFKKIEKISIKMQKALKIKRNQNIRFQKGAQWFSITDNLAREVLSKEDWVKQVFKYGYCVDEIFLQTIVENSEFVNRLYYNKADGSHRNTMRYIDWSSTRPHTFTCEDIDKLKESKLMFARKFDCDVDSVVIKKIYDLYKR